MKPAGLTVTRRQNSSNCHTANEPYPCPETTTAPWDTVTLRSNRGTGLPAGTPGPVAIGTFHATAPDAKAVGDILALDIRLYDNMT